MGSAILSSFANLPFVGLLFNIIAYEIFPPMHFSEILEELVQAVVFAVFCNDISDALTKYINARFEREDKGFFAKLGRNLDMFFLYLQKLFISIVCTFIYAIMMTYGYDLASVSNKALFMIFLMIVAFYVIIHKKDYKSLKNAVVCIFFDLLSTMITMFMCIVVVNSVTKDSSNAVIIVPVLIIWITLGIVKKILIYRELKKNK